MFFVKHESLDPNLLLFPNHIFLLNLVFKQHSKVALVSNRYFTRKSYNSLSILCDESQKNFQKINIFKYLLAKESYTLEFAGRITLTDSTNSSVL